MFGDLVIARIVEPTSKVNSLRVLADLGAEAMSYRTIQRHLGKVIVGKYRDVIAAHCDGYCGRTSATIRTARSRSSFGVLADMSDNSDSPKIGSLRKRREGSDRDRHLDRAHLPPRRWQVGLGRSTPIEFEAIMTMPADQAA